MKPMALDSSTYLAINTKTTVDRDGQIVVDMIVQGTATGSRKETAKLENADGVWYILDEDGLILLTESTKEKTVEAFVDRCEATLATYAIHGTL